VRILKLFRSLSAGEREELVAQLKDMISPTMIQEDLTAEQLSRLDEGIAQAERGDIVPADEVFDRLASRFQFAKA
jgi:predicted transcriptional regulator